jgi:hypothetical protein
MAAINITKKDIDILVNGEEKASFEQKAMDADYDVSVSPSTVSNSEGDSSSPTYSEHVHVVTFYIGVDDDFGTDGAGYSVNDGNGNTILSDTFTTSGGTIQVDQYVFINETPPLSPSIDSASGGETGYTKNLLTYEGDSTVSGVTQS